LELFVPPIFDYQAAFIRNRSCDDQIFIARRILEERWNHGQQTVLLSLDLKKAFDSIQIKKIPSLLSEIGVPHCFINRIITTVLYERNCIQWCGERTPFVEKSIGVKQGGPLSPFLSIIIMHYCKQKLHQTLSQHYNIELCIGEPCKPLQLPLSICYADDEMFLCENVSQITAIVETYLPILEHFGLSINDRKSELMLKSAHYYQNNPPHEMTFGPLKIPVVKQIKHLGVIHAHNMDRKHSIKDRLNSGVRIVKMLIPHLKKMKLPIHVLMQLYHIVIAPTIIYGLKTISLTQANRRSLRNREILIVRDLVSIAYPSPANIQLSRLLHFRTINRKISIQRIRYHAHISRRSNDSLIAKAYHFQLYDKRKLGRPLYTFHNTLHSDQIKFDSMIQEDWEDLYPFKDALKRATSILYENENLDDDPLDPELMIYPESDDDIIIQ
jgi:Reverse transcriptase (RNA-dependent DNA polymerase)